VVSGDISETRSVSLRDERGGGDVSSGDRSRSNQRKDKNRESSGKGGERESSRQKHGRESERSRVTAVREEQPDKEEADRRILAETQRRIEARRAARDIETAHATIRELRESHSIGRQRLINQRERNKNERRKMAVRNQQYCGCPRKRPGAK